MQTPIYKIETFEGPLDLLLTLIQKNKMDICDIQITEIFNQYMFYIDTMREMNMEVAGEFIVIATELMYIKSRMLLPKMNLKKKTLVSALHWLFSNIKKQKKLQSILKNSLQPTDGVWQKILTKSHPTQSICPNRI